MFDQTKCPPTRSHNFVGVVLFTILGGYPPFYQDAVSATFQQICQVDYEFASTTVLEWSVSGCEAVDPVFFYFEYGGTSIEACLDDWKRR